MSEDKKKEESDILYFKDIGQEAQNFIAGNAQHTLDDKEAEATISNMMGGPMVAVETLMENTFITEPLHKCVTCHYEEIKNTVSGDRFEELHSIMLSNAYQYSKLMETIKEGMENVNKVFYVNPHSGKPYDSPEEIARDFTEEDGLMFLTATVDTTVNEHKVILNVIDFVDDALFVKSDVLKGDELEWVSFDYKTQLPLREEEGESQ